MTFSVNAGDYSVENPPNDDRSGSSFTGVKFGGADANNSGDVVEAVGWIEGSTLRWFAIGSGHKVITGTVASDVAKGTLAPLSVDLRPVDGRNISVSATALTDLKAGANVIAWWNGPVRRWVMTDPSKLTYQAGADVAIDSFALAGAGLVPGAGCSLNVNPGCGLEMDAAGEKLKIRPQDIAGAGLEGDLFQPGECMIQVDFATNCGLAIDTNDKLTVDMTTLAGPGLTEWTNPWGCVGLQVDQATVVDAGCGLEVDPVTQKLKVAPADLAGSGLTTEGACGLAVDCNYIKNSCLGGFSGTKNVVTDILCDPYDRMPARSP